MLLLIYPPISILSEPPVGIARLSGALTEHHIPHEIIDANIEGIHWILKNASFFGDTWSKRAAKNLDINLKTLKDGSVFNDMEKYKKTVLEINRILYMAGLEKNVKITLSDYTHNHLSPLRINDLITSAKEYNKNPFFGYFSERIGNFLETHKTDIVGISINYLGQALCAFAIIGFLRYNYGDIKIILGGSLINSWSKRGLKEDRFNGLIHKIIFGPGEKPLLSIYGKNISYYKNTMPNYEKFKKDLYLSKGFILPYNTSVGCYWNKCTFCPERAEENDYIQTHPETVIKELKELITKTGPCLIHLTDNAIHPYVLHALINTPISVPWYGFVRINKFMEDMDYCMKLKQSGCVLLKIGIESADQKVVNRMKKGINIEKAKKVLKNIKTAGIGTYIYLLFGTPFETEESLKKTVDFIIENESFIDFLNIAIFNMPLGSPDAQGLELKTFYEGDLSLYTDFVHPNGLHRKYIRRFIDKTIKKHPIIKRILDRHPRFFMSNHAPFFIMARGKVC